MPRLDNQFQVTPSVLDRLIDYEPRETREPPRSRSSSIQELKNAVRRDLEWLLNTRCYLEAPEHGLEETKKSLAFYGLPDITGLSAQNPDEQNRLAAALENAIRTFEPRFLNLKITMEPPSHTERAIKFRINAQLDVDPAPEPVMFDTVLELGSGDFAVREVG
ncbi:MAG TPA: type VI secretion system baseplate subunit TssE [Pyrinomonadaceae bacterium]|jgi:type VI secretion system protein ImpF|nr:type VI secretion system baseplate subunit TssE [Pyrinomonadaceae bacterium]